MPEIHRFNTRVKLCMYADHAPPHFHLRGPGWSALIDIETLIVRRADKAVPRKEIKRAVDWARANMELLRREWERLNERDD
jgi:hypothetical protein